MVRKVIDLVMVLVWATKYCGSQETEVDKGN